MSYILDTNMITALMKNDEKVWTKLDEKTFRGDEVFMNGISYYEIKRGLLATNATKKLSIFERFCREFGILFLDNQEIFDTASEIYADLKQKGKLVQDADILIAALAITRNIILVSNDSDFMRIGDVVLENWLE